MSLIICASKLVHSSVKPCLLSYNTNILNGRLKSELHFNVNKSHSAGFSTRKFSPGSSSGLKRFNSDNEALFGPIQKPKSMKVDCIESHNDTTWQKLDEKSLHVREVLKGKNSSHSRVKVVKIFHNEKNAESFAATGVGIRHYSTVATTSSSKSTSSNRELLAKNRLNTKLEALQRFAELQKKLDILKFPLLRQEENDITFEAAKLLTNQMERSSYFPSVSTVLNTTMSAQSLAMLERWKQRKISELGLEGFQVYQKNILSRGKLLHHNIRLMLTGSDISDLTMTENIEKLWQSLQSALPLINGVELCESAISHPYLCYKGIVDCVAHYNNNLVIIEWKTSEKHKPTLKDVYDNPLQAVAYLAAINHDVNLNMVAKEIVLIYAYEDGSNAQIHHLDYKLCLEYWNKWLTRLSDYWKTISIPIQ